MQTQWIFYFGYGSLVNRETRPAGERSYPARLRGWRRAWEHRVVGHGNNAGCTSLSIEPVRAESDALPDREAIVQAGQKPGEKASDVTSEPAMMSAQSTGKALARGSQTGIDGVLVLLPIEDLPNLDQREAGYDRLTLDVTDFEISDSIRASLPDAVQLDSVAVYRSQMQNRQRAEERHPILQSYVDCVLAGYLKQFGEAGVHYMLASSRGWDAFILDDRSAPRYPRAVSVNGRLQRQFDEWLEPYRIA